MDKDIRELERLAQAGDREAAADLYFMDLRVGASNRGPIEFPIPPLKVIGIVRKWDYYTTLDIETSPWVSNQLGFNFGMVTEDQREWLSDRICELVRETSVAYSNYCVGQYQKALRNLLGVRG